MALALLLDDALLTEPDLAPVRAYLHAAGDKADDRRRAARAARRARGAPLRGVHLLARRDARGLAARSDSRRGPRGDRALAAASLARRCSAMLGWRGPPRRASCRSTRPSRASSRGCSSCRARSTSSASRTSRARSTSCSNRIGKLTEVVVYALTPCEGFWEDVDRRDPAPLHLWSRPGREHVRALNAIAGFDHDDRFVDPLENTPRTLLRQLQSDVLHRERQPSPAEPRRAFERDASIERSRTREHPP